MNFFLPLSFSDLFHLSSEAEEDLYSVDLYSELKRLTASKKVILIINVASGHKIANSSYIKSLIYTVAPALNICLETY